MADRNIFGAAAGSGIGSDKSGERKRSYNPYENLPSSIPYRHIYDLPTSPEYLFAEESAVQRRSWGENLTFYTGTAYLAGATAGAAVGLRSAAAGAEPGESLKIRVNRLLNSCGAEGRRYSNRLGTLGLLYAGIESGAAAVRSGHGDDWVNAVVAGLGTGAIYKAANGVRSAAVAGALGAVLAACATGGRHIVKRYVPI